MRGWSAPECLTYLPVLSVGNGSVFSEPSRCLMRICTLPSASSSSFLAGGGEPNALFEELERVFEAQIALFELIDDGFELLERFFEGWHLHYSVIDAPWGRTLAMTSAAAL